MAEPGLGDGDVEVMAETLRTLGHGTRLRLLATLFSRGEQSVGDLEKMTGIGQPGLSQQLAILRKAGLVDTRREAKQVYYRLVPEALRPVAAFVRRMAEEPPAPVPASQPSRGSAATFAKIL